MKNSVLILTFFISAFSFAQNTDSINGNMLDLESNNEPLAFAKVVIKENGREALSDENGFFKFQSLAEGTYTLIFNFIGYQTKELEVKVVSDKTTKVKLHLEASTISLNDLVSLVASTDTASSTTNK